MIKSKLIKTFSIIIIFCAILTTITFFGCKDNDYPEAGPKIVSVDGGTIDGNNILIIVDNSVTAVSLADKIVSEDGSTWSLCTNVRNEIANKIATFDNGLKLGDNKFYVLVTKDGFSSIYTLTVHRRCEVEVRYLFGSKTLKTEDKESYREYPIDYVPEIDGYTFNYWQDNDGNPIDKFTTTNEPLTIVANTTVIPYNLTIDTDNNTHGSVSITIPNKQDKINDEEGKFLGYRYGAKIRLTAYQHASCNFIGWFDEEDNFMSGVPEIEFNIYTNTFIKAKFEPQPVLLDYEYTATRTSCTIDGVKDKTITTLVIPNVFTDIASDAFSDCDNLQSIVMGDTIVGISAGAFRGAKSLTSVTLGKNITSLSAFMFQDCYSLEEFVVPEHINYIGYGAFYGCVNLRSITMGDHVFGIAQFAFKDCTKLADITLSTKISTISKGMFQNCDSIVEYVVPNNINRIDAEAFSECDNLYSFTMGDNVTNIGIGIFRNCISLTDITLSTKLSTITQRMFQNCDSLVEYVVPDHIKSIGSEAFSDCDNLYSFTMGDNVTRIDRELFRNCISLTDITLSTKISTISKGMFQNCDSLVEYVVPNNINRIDSEAFSECDNLYSFTMGDNVTYIGIGIFRNCISLTDITLSTKLSTITQGMFQNCDSLVEYVVPDHIKSIDFEAFSDCDNLYSFTMGDNVTNIGTGIFRHCRSLVDIKLSNSITIINYDTFQGCSGLVEYVIPDNITTIRKGAFAGCANLRRLTVGKNVQTIEIDSFKNCKKVLEICNKSSLNLLYNDGMSEIARKALNVYSPELEVSKILYDKYGFIYYIDNGTYYMCGYKNEFNSTKLILPDSINGNVYYIMDGVFNYCNSIREIVIPDTLTEFNKNAFNFCTNLVKVTIGSNVTKIEGTLLRSNKLIEVYNRSKYLIQAGNGINSLSKSVKNVYTPTQGSSKLVYENGFIFYNDNGNYSLISTENVVSSKLYLPQSVNGATYTIADNAFYEESRLNELVITNGVTAIGNNAFYYSGLKTVILGDDLVSIGDEAFALCYNIEKVVFGNSLKSIGNYAFSNCDELTKLVFPSSLVSIGEHAFDTSNILGIYNSLVEVYIPKNVTQIGTSAFDGCSEDIVYYVEAETIPDTWSDFWHGGYPINAVLGSEMPTEN